MLFFDSVGIIIGRLRMFMQIHIVENTIGTRIENCFICQVL